MIIQCHLLPSTLNEKVHTMPRFLPGNPVDPVEPNFSTPGPMRFYIFSSLVCRYLVPPPGQSIAEVHSSSNQISSPNNERTLRNTRASDLIEVRHLSS